MKKIFTIVSTLAFILSFASCQKDSSSDGPGDDEEIIELDIPSGLKLAEYGDESIKMAWEPVDKAEYYAYKVIAQVVRDDEAVDSLVLMGETFNTYKTIEKLDSICVKNGYNYWFTVAARAGKLSASKYCEYVRCEPGGLTPLVPDDVTLVGFTDNGLTYEWTGVDGADYYNYILTNPKGEIIRKGDTDATSLTLDGLKKGRYYYLSVAGANPSKRSDFSKKVEGLTYGEYLPALIFNATMADGNFSFVEGTELTITDGTYTAGYVVKSSGKTTTLELTTEEEVQYNQPKYTAMMPLALSEGGTIPAAVTIAEDGTFAGVPCWAEGKGTDLVFHSFYSVISLNVSSVKSAEIDKVVLRSDRSLSGRISSVTAGSEPSINFAPGDDGVELAFAKPIRVSTVPQTIRTIAPIGKSTNLCAIFQNEGAAISGNLIGVDNIKETDKPTVDISFMVVETVAYSSVDGKLPDASKPDQNAVISYASIRTGTVDDYDYGILVTDFLSHNWNKAVFIPGEIISQGGGTFVFRTPLDNVGTNYVRPCVKPKGLPNLSASVGEECFLLDLDFSKSDLILPATAEQSAMAGLSAYGNEFPTEQIAIKNGKSLSAHLYSVNGLPVAFGANKQSADRDYALWWDKANGLLKSNKMRIRFYTNLFFPTYRLDYIYWVATASKKYFIGNSSTAGSQLGASTSHSVLEQSNPANIVCDKTIYLGCDSNTESSKRIFLWLVKKPE